MIFLIKKKPTRTEKCSLKDRGELEQKGGGKLLPIWAAKGLMLDTTRSLRGSLAGNNRHTLE